MGDTPDGFGDGGDIDFGGAARLLFISDGSLVDEDDCRSTARCSSASRASAHSARHHADGHHGARALLRVERKQGGRMKRSQQRRLLAHRVAGGGRHPVVRPAGRRGGVPAGAAQLSGSHLDVLAREKAAEAIESVFTSRDTRTVQWAQIRNVAGEDGAGRRDLPRRTAAAVALGPRRPRQHRRRRRGD